MAVALDTPTQEIFTKPSRPRTAWFMTLGFLIYTLLIVVGHIVGFPLGYAYLHTVCLSGCGLTPGNVVSRHGLHRCRCAARWPSQLDFVAAALQEL